MIDQIINSDYKGSESSPMNVDNGMKLFQSPEFGQVRTVMNGSEVMFCATDVAKCLGYVNPRDAVAKHCKSTGVAKRDVGVQTGSKSDGTPSIQNVKMTFITKGNVIRLVANSTLPQAEKVESWIFDEVIPSVLETGGYIATKQDDTPEEIMARALMIAQDTITKRNERIKQLETDNQRQQVLIEQKDIEITVKDEKIKILAPKGKSYDAIMSSEGLVTTNMIAAFLGISAVKLNKLLCDWGIQYKQSKCYFLTARYKGKGYTKHVPYPYLDNGVQKSREHMYWTEIGRKFVIDLYHSKMAA
ncbi:MAG TPA: phage antirepressor KilAC domain-containing protein [Candidatus Bacteroides pullicola]|uniref:Phage antirepressor KilAC domain-containing protein n=1 Tax=Candidatus Bacteroides pullicola TaxID=2838475 RepID=A0A9D2CL96_9BACE|nr:phage antirepressor KilAC domain-containing protein [Candidatus Bacteroides pullicola]